MPWGCASLSGQTTRGMTRFRCAECNYNLCEPCAERYCRREGLAQAKDCFRRMSVLQKFLWCGGLLLALAAWVAWETSIAWGDFSFCLAEPPRLAPEDLERAGLHSAAAAVRGSPHGWKWEHRGVKFKWPLPTSTLAGLNGMLEAKDGNITVEWEPYCGGAVIKGSFFNTSAKVFLSRSLSVAGCDDLPAACLAILETDVANATTAPQCSDWCDAALGSSAKWTILSPYCASKPNAAAAYVAKACSKARLAVWFEPVEAPGWQIAVLALYLGAGSRLLMKSKLAPKGRLPSPEPRSGLTCDLPLCCFSATSDAHRAKWQLITSLPCVIFDNPLDVLGILSYCKNGQPSWAALTLCGLLPVVMKDPLQTRTITSAWEATEQRYATPTFLESQLHEGGHEAPFGGVIALLALLLTMPATVPLSSLLLRMASAGSSFVLAMPGAARAEALLEKSRKDPSVLLTYPRFELAKKAVPTSAKYGPAARALGCASLIAWFLSIEGSQVMSGLPMAALVLATAGLAHDKKVSQLVLAGAWGALALPLTGILKLFVHSVEDPCALTPAAASTLWALKAAATTDGEALADHWLLFLVAGMQLGGMLAGFVGLVMGWIVWNPLRKCVKADMAKFLAAVIPDDGPDDQGGDQGQQMTTP